MGLGKTLSAIAVLWTLVKGRKHRGVIVCPSSLIDNWKRELNRWLPNCKLLPLVLAPGGDSKVIFNQFKYVCLIVCLFDCLLVSMAII